VSALCNTAAGLALVVSVILNVWHASIALNILLSIVGIAALSLGANRILAIARPRDRH
jgi:hypothetical protein